MSADFFFSYFGARWRPYHMATGVFEDKVPCVCLMRGPGTDMFSGHPSLWKSLPSLQEQAGCFCYFL